MYYIYLGYHTIIIIVELKKIGHCNINIFCFNETKLYKFDESKRKVFANFAIFLWEGNCTEYPTSGLPNSKLDHIYIFYI